MCALPVVAANTILPAIVSGECDDGVVEQALCLQRGGDVADTFIKCQCHPTEYVAITLGDITALVVK